MLPINTEIERYSMESTAINISVFAIGSSHLLFYIFCLNCGKMPEYGGDRGAEGCVSRPPACPCLRTSLAYPCMWRHVPSENLLSLLPGRLPPTVIPGAPL